MTRTATKEIHIQYFAILREQSGLGEETVSTSAQTAEQLYDELQGRYGFKLPSDILKVAVNGAFRNWHTELNHNDRVVFIQPVAGG